MHGIYIHNINCRPDEMAIFVKRPSLVLWDMGIQTSQVWTSVESNQRLKNLYLSVHSQVVGIIIIIIIIIIRLGQGLIGSVSG